MTCREALETIVSTADDIIKEKEQTGQYSNRQKGRKEVNHAQDFRV